MKRAICLLLAALLLGALFAGCDLQNRKPSSDFIPETVPTEPTEPPETESEESTEETATAVMQVMVRELIIEEGTYTDRYNNRYTYKYHVPFIDAEASYAQICNREIDQVFGAEVKKQQSAMTDGSTLTVASVDYEYRLRGNILTLYVTMQYFEEEESKLAVYMLDRTTGEEIAGEELLKFLGIDKETFLALAEATVETYFEQTYGESRRTDQLRYNTAHDRTMREELFNVEMPMYIDKDDHLTIEATIYDLAGEPHVIPLVVETEQPAEE